MKYKAIIETDEFENFEFYEDGNGKYIQGIDAGAVNSEWIPLYFTECKQESVLDKIRAEIKEWYWQADKQALAKDPCVVDAMVDLFIRTIDKYKAESEDKE